VETGTRLGHWWIGVAIALVVGSTFVMIRAIARLVRNHRSSVVTTVPLAAEQTVVFEAAGPMILNVRGPRFSRSFAELEYTLHEVDTAAPVALNTILLRAETSGLSAVQLAILSLDIREPGEYHLAVAGLTPDTATGDHQLVFTRDRRADSVRTVLLLVASALGLVGGSALGLVAFLTGTHS